MKMNEALVAAAGELFPMFGLTPELREQRVLGSLSSSSQVNILIGLSNGARGNIVLGMDKPTAKRVVSGMMGGWDVQELDAMVKSALGELANMLVGSAAGKVGTSSPIELSPPTLVIGDDVLFAASRVEASHLILQLNDSVLNITCSIE